MDKIYFTRRSNGLGRTGYAWVETPGSALAGQVQHELIQPHTQKRDHRGLLIEGLHRNYLLRSSNLLGVAGISPGALAGTGVSGSAIADDTADTISGPITNPFPRSYRFTAGSPHSADLAVQLPNSIATGTLVDVDPGAPYWLTMWLKNDSSATNADEVVWEARRPVAVGGDDNYWNHGTRTWQAGALWNSTGNKAAGTKARYLAAIDDNPATQPGLRIRFGLKSGGTAGRIAHVYHVGLDKAAFPCWSPVIADDAAAAGYPSYVESGSDELRHDCREGDPFSVVRGTILLRAVLPFGMDELLRYSNPAFFRLIGASGGGGGAFFGELAGGPRALRFSYGAATVSVSLGVDTGPMSEMRMAFRWTSSLAELGLDRRADVFYSPDGSTWSQNNVGITTLTDGVAQAWFPGGDGTVRSSTWLRWEVLPICLPDAEIKARLS